PVMMSGMPSWLTSPVATRTSPVNVVASPLRVLLYGKNWNSKAASLARKTLTSAPLPSLAAVTRKAGNGVSVTAAVEELLAGLVSVVPAETLAVLLTVTVPAPVGLGTSVKMARTTTVKVAEAPAARVGVVAVMVPVVPTAGVVTAKAGPAVCASETKVVPTGTTSVSCTFWASLGPLLTTVMV